MDSHRNVKMAAELGAAQVGEIYLWIYLTSKCRNDLLFNTHPLSSLFFFFFSLSITIVNSHRITHNLTGWSVFDNKVSDNADSDVNDYNNK